MSGDMSVRRCTPWSLLHCGAFPEMLHFFCGQIVATPKAHAAEGQRFEAFLTRCMLFVHDVLKSKTYRGSQGSSLEINLAARSQACRLSAQVPATTAFFASEAYCTWPDASLMVPSPVFNLCFGAPRLAFNLICASGLCCAIGSDAQEHGCGGQGQPEGVLERRAAAAAVHIRHREDPAPHGAASLLHIPTPLCSCATAGCCC